MQNFIAIILYIYNFNDFELFDPYKREIQQHYKTQYDYYRNIFWNV